MGVHAYKATEMMWIEGAEGRVLNGAVVKHQSSSICCNFPAFTTTLKAKV